MQFPIIGQPIFGIIFSQLKMLSIIDGFLWYRYSAFDEAVIMWQIFFDSILI